LTLEAVFSINLHLRDLPLLQEIQAYFGGIGRISVGEKAVIISHFVKYPLITKSEKIPPF